MSKSDSAYHHLFSIPAMVEELLSKYVPESWVAELDFTTLQRENIKLHHRNYPTDDIIRREGDLLWRVQTKDGDDRYLLILLELQSRSDKWMAVRFLAYTALLYQHLIKEKRLTKEGKLPPVFPLVLYNGLGPWRACHALHDLIALPEGSPLWLYQPCLLYYVIDEKDHLPESKIGPSPTELVFALEHAPSAKDLIGYIKALIDMFSQSMDPILKEAMLDWFRYSKLVERFDLPPEKLTGLRGDHKMTAEQIDRWEEELRQEGREEGRQEGREEAREEGRHTIKKAILTAIILKFGAERREEASNRLAQITDHQILQTLADTVLTASTLEELFEG